MSKFSTRCCWWRVNFYLGLKGYDGSASTHYGLRLWKGMARKRSYLRSRSTESSVILHPRKGKCKLEFDNQCLQTLNLCTSGRFDITLNFRFSFAYFSWSTSRTLVTSSIHCLISLLPWNLQCTLPELSSIGFTCRNMRSRSGLNILRDAQGHDQ